MKGRKGGRRKLHKNILTSSTDFLLGIPDFCREGKVPLGVNTNRAGTQPDGQKANSCSESQETKGLAGSRQLPTETNILFPGMDQEIHIQGRKTKVSLLWASAISIRAIESLNMEAPFLISMSNRNLKAAWMDLLW